MPRNYFLLFLFLLLIPAPLFAAALVNINTADLATLETLNGIGASKGQAIIDYRTQHGPFAAIQDIMNVSGIGTATYNNIKDSITVDSTPQAQSQTQPQSQATTSQSTQTQTVSSVGGAGPPAITARITADVVTTAGAGTYFSGASFGTAGEPLAGARYIWNFGDGATAEGAGVLHTYMYPGSYDVELSVGYNYSSATARLMVTAKTAQVRLVLQADNSLLVANDSAQDLSIGGWALVSAGKSFVIPQDTIVHAQGGVRFAPSIMGFAAARGAILEYPNNTTAAVSSVAGDSPLHGEQVALLHAPVAGKTSPAPTAAPAASGGQAAAVATSPAAKEVAWSYSLGLAAIIALGAVGAYYAHTKPVRSYPDETGAGADEFEIE